MQRIRRWVARFQVWSCHPNIIWTDEQAELRTVIEIQNWLPLVILLILLVWYIASPSITVAFFLAGFAALFFFSLWWAVQMSRHLRGRRILQYAAMQVGDELEEKILLTNHSFLPALWVELLDRSDIPGYTVSSVRGVSGSSDVSWRVHAVCTLRGVFRLGPWDMHTGDPFGFFLVRLQNLHRQEILVYPPLAALPADLLPHRGSLGDHRPLRQPLQAVTVDSMSVREYIQGDPLHHIHWPTTARQDSPFVKVFQPEAASRVWVFPDLDPTTQLGSGADSTEETTILLSASLIAELLRAKLTVGLFAGGDPSVLLLPQRGELQLWSALEKLAPLHPQPGVNLARSIQQFRPLVSQRDLLIFITSSLNPDWIFAARNLLHRRGSAVARALILDPLSFGGKQSAEMFLPAVSDANIEARLIRQGEIKPLPGVYGELSRWDFITSGTGRAVARQAPRRAAMVFAGQQQEQP
jgi:uncharacterized protein (DUF58 family)